MELNEAKDLSSSDKKNFFQVCRGFLAKVTVEPVAFMYATSYGLNEVIRSSLIVEKICQNKLNFTSEICGNLTNNQEIQEEVQRHVTDYEALKSSLSLIPL